MDFKDRIQNIKDKWFLTEPAYFMVICTHDICLSAGLNCPIAVGGGVIYINENAYKDKTDRFLEESLKVELIRILLKHPYQRQLPNRIKSYLASNFVIANNTNFTELRLKTTREFFNSWEYDRESFEAIYDAIKLPEQKEGEGEGEGEETEEGKRKPTSSKRKKSKNSSGQGSPENDGDPFKNFDDGCSSSDDAFERTQFWKEDD